MVEIQYTAKVIESILDSIDITDLGFTDFNFLFGHATDISIRLNQDPNNFPLVVLFYSDLKERFSSESTVYLNSEIRLYFMLPSEFKKLDQEETYTNAIDIAQELIQRVVDNSDVYPGINEIKEWGSDPQENWNMILNSRISDDGKVKVESEFVFDHDLSGRDMRFNLEILTKQKCN